jgi:predicted DNA-binding transcriptional regulator AlpA
MDVRQKKSFQDPNRLLRLSQVLQFIPISRACWFNFVKSGKAPPAIKIGNCSFWRYGDLLTMVGKEAE